MSQSKVVLGHGGGGKLTGSLIKKYILPSLDRGLLSALPDSVVLTGLGDRIAYTTDSFVVSPIFFPGGDIGSLSIHGTCNDLACSGARPKYISMGLILEEGLDLDVLEKILSSAANAADEVGVQVVTGDTKVVPRGSADKIFINTSGIGVVESNICLGPEKITPGDKILVSGPIGNHGMAVMLSRAEFSFDFDLKSDSACIWPIAEQLLKLGDDLKFMRDPTRGGLAATLNEIATASMKGVSVRETQIPIDESVAAAAEILGIDPMVAANEGKLVAVISQSRGEEALDLLSQCPLANHAVIVGEVNTKNPGKVVLETAIGGTRIVSEPSGELLPRIC